MTCCEHLDDAIERGAFYFGAKHRIDDGRIVNDVSTEYFIKTASSRGFDYWGLTIARFAGALYQWVCGRRKRRNSS